MKTTATKTALNDGQEKTLNDIATQLVMALESDNTPEAVKDCLKSIVIEASSEASGTTSIIGFDDLSLVRQAFPDIIKNLNLEYGRGVLHSIHAILRFDTKAVEGFYAKRLDEKPTEFDDELTVKTRNEFNRSLADWDISKEIRAQKFERAKRLLDNILFVAEGAEYTNDKNEKITVDVVAGDLLELLEIFLIKSENFSGSDLAEELQWSVFGWAKEWSKGYNKWRFRVFSDRGLDDNGNEVETAPEVKADSAPVNLSELPAECQQLNKLARHFGSIKNPKLPAKLYDVIADELCEHHADTASPDYIKANLLHNSRLQDS